MTRRSRNPQISELARRKAIHESRVRDEPLRCWYCGAELQYVLAEIDHIIPLARGGKDITANMAICCRSCNRDKNAKLLSEWRPSYWFESNRAVAVERDRSIRSIDRRLVAPVNFYLAGKIRAGDWRQSLLADGMQLRSDLAANRQGEYAYNCADVIPGDYMPDWPIAEGALIGGHNFAGPYFMSCDHGCYHGPGSHGVKAVGGQWGHWDGKDAWDERQALVFQRCMSAIQRSDVVFAWIEAAASIDGSSLYTCYGTLVELGIAYQMGKHIWIGYPRQLNETQLWFAEQTATASSWGESPLNAFTTLLKQAGLPYESPTPIMGAA